MTRNCKHSPPMSADRCIRILGQVPSGACGPHREPADEQPSRCGGGLGHGDVIGSGLPRAGGCHHGGERGANDGVPDLKATTFGGGRPPGPAQRNPGPAARVSGLCVGEHLRAGAKRIRGVPGGSGGFRGVPGGSGGCVPPGQHSAAGGSRGVVPPGQHSAAGGSRGVVPPGQHSAAGGSRGVVPPGQHSAAGESGGRPPDYNGMLPCFLGGSVWRLVRSARRARVTSERVSAGRMTASR